MATKQIIGTALVAAALSLAGPAPVAQANPNGCSNMTIKGSYGYSGSGAYFGQPMASVGTATFDGAGNFTWTSNGFPGETLTGTYTIDADCRGLATFNFPYGLGAAPGDIVVLQNGKEVLISPPGGSTGGPYVAVYVYKRL